MPIELSGKLLQVAEWVGERGGRIHGSGFERKASHVFLSLSERQASQGLLFKAVA